MGEPLPRAAAAYGVRRKLAGYSLDLAHEVGGPKALGFKRILGIMLADIDYVEGAIYMGILLMPVSSVEENPPWGISCVVNMPLRGRGEKSGRVVNLRTAWAIDYPGALPRLASAYLKP
ncbi:MAG: DUF6883 domain-containing protein [Solirubrobacteraceae bacterium]